METLTQLPTPFSLQETLVTSPYSQLHYKTLLHSCSTIPHLRQTHAQMIKTGLINNNSLFNSLLTAYSRSSSPKEAFSLYNSTRRCGASMNQFGFPPLLKAIAICSGWKEGREIHGYICKLGFEFDPFIVTGLIKMYAFCGEIFKARKLFDKMPERDVITWSVMIDAYTKLGFYEEAFMLFREMRRAKIEPDKVVLSSVLSASGQARNLELGKEIHSYVRQKGLGGIDLHLEGALVHMYTSCGSMEQAREIFNRMAHKSLASWTAMVFGYCKVGKVETARSLFNEMPEKDLVSWSAMLAGYVESERPNDGLKLFQEMQLSDIRPDQITILSVLSACSALGALDQGRWAHRFIDSNGFNNTMSVNNALIDMYAKCGSLEGSKQVFDNMPERNVVSWTSMINGYAMHGDGEAALELFYRMRNEAVEPNEVTFVGVLYACSHAGLVTQGLQIFKEMKEDYKLVPWHEHYGCVADLLGRAGLLGQAQELIESMPLRPNVIVWGSLLGACKIHGNTKLGELAAKKLLELDPDHDGAHVLLSNIYAKFGRWDEALGVRKMMKKKGVLKEPGFSWIELKSMTHEFVVGDRSHPQIDLIYDKLDEIFRVLISIGYSPNTSNVLVDLEEDKKREALLLHSEKLAVSFGLLNFDHGLCMRIVKNLRICEDCHCFMKLISKAFDREIILRDRHRFHHFKNGTCSCKDYW
ncbi:pentatricopeptide repeat-containing protein At4g14820 [Amborella trichopoda]|uniref:pentatricopeptide repeat-containing protein At4g14820 n=1 Tax=Amborella trichopoda TaxID=13333 RepID=UPI0009BE683C|nr:pentatricopeptide repeat-containing protein At4g14820 [Amborella trichopoda]|eukprot:XP_011629039.2 pentatricopeptide repeat-containing protein At4g14820 [Amborella trichopoda]